MVEEAMVVVIAMVYVVVAMIVEVAVMLEMVYEVVAMIIMVVVVLRW